MADGPFCIKVERPGRAAPLRLVEVSRFGVHDDGALWVENEQGEVTALFAKGTWEAVVKLPPGEDEEDEA